VLVGVLVLSAAALCAAIIAVG